MSDIHRLPLTGHDLPDYYLAISKPTRYHVFSRRERTGQLYWYWSRPGISGIALVGPFMTCADAHKDIERGAYAVAGP